MELLIRTAQLTDAESITQLSNQLGYTTTIEKMQQRLSAILPNTDNCVFVMTANGQLIAWIHGCYSLRVESDPFVEIGGLVVDADHRRKGIGRMLIEKIIRWALVKNCDKIRVRCNTLRKDSHEFYNSIGFTWIKEQKIFDRPINNTV